MSGATERHFHCREEKDMRIEGNEIIIEKWGYAILAGVIGMAAASAPDGISPNLGFAIGFFAVFIGLLILEFLAQRKLRPEIVARKDGVELLWDQRTATLTAIISLSGATATIPVLTSVAKIELLDQVTQKRQQLVDQINKEIEENLERPPHGESSIDLASAHGQNN
jgi:hypothetical protein